MTDVDAQRDDSPTAADPTPGTRISRVLVPFDSSDLAITAATWARSLATDLGVDLVVVAPPTNASTEHDVPDEERFEDEARSAARGELRRAGVAVDAVVVTEKGLDDELIDTARSDDVVVVGVHHREGRTRWALGSPAHELAHRLRCPLLLVPPGDGAPSGEAPVVAGLDGRGETSRVAAWAKSLAQALDRPLVAVYAYDPMYDTFDNAGDYGREERAARHEARHVDADELLEPAGPAEHALRRIAHERDAFLTVVGVREHASMGGALLGKLVDHFIHTAPGPIAIVTHDGES